jgi:hypothetical protein
MKMPPVQRNSGRDLRPNNQEPGGGQKANQRRRQAMGMLEENAPDPFGNGEEKHVVAAGIRPVRHGQSRAVAGHQSAHADQNESGQRGENRESLQPIFLVWVKLTFNNNIANIKNAQPEARGFNGVLF